MIEATILDYLAEKLDVPVFLEIPETPSDEHEELPDEFVLIQRIGGDEEEHDHDQFLCIPVLCTETGKGD